MLPFAIMGDWETGRGEGGGLQTNKAAAFFN